MTDPFNVADHLDDRTREAMLELPKHATIGDPYVEVKHLLENDQE